MLEGSPIQPRSTRSAQLTRRGNNPRDRSSSRVRRLEERDDAPRPSERSRREIDRRQSASEERRLLLRYHRGGDSRARDQLVERFLPLARQLARRYQRGSEPLDDLVQVASVGLVKAIDRFDPARTTAFTSYAVPTMVGELKRYLRDFGWAVRVPRGMKERTVSVQATVTSLAKELGRSPSAAEVAGELDLDEKQVLEAFEASLAYNALSLEAPRLGEEEAGDPVFGDALGEEDGRYELVELTATIAPALRDLDERDRRILHMRFFEDMSQSEIARRIGVSQMQISRLIRRSLARLAAAEEVHACGEEQDGMVSGPSPVDGRSRRPPLKLVA